MVKAQEDGKDLKKGHTALGLLVNLGDWQYQRGWVGLSDFGGEKCLGFSTSSRGVMGWLVFSYAIGKVE